MAFRPTVASAAESVPLASLEPGARAVVEHVDGDPEVTARLLDLGLVPGTPVRVLRRSPLGDPRAYELRGYRLCLRGSEARHVRVRRTLRAGPAAAG